MAAIALASACALRDTSLARENSTSDTGLDSSLTFDLDALFVGDGSPADEPASSPGPCAPDSGTGELPDTNDDVFGIDCCRPSPARLVVLGDSIAACASATCATNLMATRLRNTVSPNLVLEIYAEDGAVIQSLPAQASRAAPGAGHVFVWIWAVGNTFLSGELTTPNVDLSPLRASFDQVFGYFGDKTLFPGGATFLLNTQFSPYDDCYAYAPASYTPEFRDWFLEVNRVLFLDVAAARPDTAAIDHYPDFLGHARNANVEGCPYCGIDNTQWTDPLGFHPNAEGNAHIAQKWFVAFDAMLGPSCAGDL